MQNRSTETPGLCQNVPVNAPLCMMLPHKPVSHNLNNKKSQNNLEEPRHHPSRQRMDSPAACASCACPQQKSPVTQPSVYIICRPTLYPQFHTTVLHFPYRFTLHYALSDFPTLKICPCPLGSSTPTGKKPSLGPPDPPPKRHHDRLNRHSSGQTDTDRQTDRQTDSQKLSVPITASLR